MSNDRALTCMIEAHGVQDLDGLVVSATGDHHQTIPDIELVGMLV